MAVYQYRIDGLTVTNGLAMVRVTQGIAPLPATWQGETIHLTKQAVIDSLQSTEDTLKSLLMNALIIIWKKNDNNLNNPNLVIGKTATLDFANNGFSVTIA